MVLSAKDCIGIDSLAAYADGGLDDVQVCRVDAHVNNCVECRKDLSALALAVSFTSLGSMSETLQDEFELESGRSFGRYVVLDTIGQGAMGIVVRAYDPKLKRAIALKIVGREVWSHASDEVRDSLLREAQAMAQLTSNHCVTIYDVVSGEEGLALAMELVEGGTLRTWLVGTHSWEEKLSTCLEAGRGLSAAHAAKIIHRDFKPDNILCSLDGRVMVTDFGLARLASDLAQDKKEIAGTPVYMAPELFDGGIATSASDQYSFCVTLFESLYGKRPFAGSSIEELQYAISAGLTSEAEVSSSFPKGVRNTLSRGLSPEPEDRYESMDALLKVLETYLPKAKTGKKRTVLAVATIVALVVLLTFVYIGSKDLDGPVCAPRTASINEAWGPNLESLAVAKNLTSLGASSDNLKKVAQAVSVYRQDWIQTQVNVCQATQLRGEQSESLLDVRMACLDRRKDELAALAAVLTHSQDRHSSDMAIEAVQGLRSPSSCAGVVQSQSLSTDDPNRAQVEETLAQVDRAKAMTAIGQPGEALGLLETLSGESLKEYPGLVGEMALARGNAHTQYGEFEKAEEVYFEALESAQKAADDHLVAAVWIELFFSAGPLAHRFELARSHEKATSAALSRIASDPELSARFLFAQGTMRLSEHAEKQAKPYLQQALDAFASLRSEMHTDVMNAHKALCDMYIPLRQFDDATMHCDEALRIGREVFGARHASLGGVYTSIGGIHFSQGKWAEALKAYALSIEVSDTPRYRKVPMLPVTHSNMGMAWLEQGKLDEAKKAFLKARSLYEEHHPDDFVRYMPVSGLGNVAMGRRDFAAAATFYEEALALVVKTHGRESSLGAMTYYNLAAARENKGDTENSAKAYIEVVRISRKVDGENNATAVSALDALANMYEASDVERALQYALQAKEMAAQVYGQKHRALAWSTVRLGNLQRLNGNHSQASELLEQALAIYESTEGGIYDLGIARLRLAQALWHERKERKRSIALMEESARNFAEVSGPNGMRMAAYANAWLDEKR